MPTATPRPLIARLRESSCLVVWALLLFVMKVGLVSACTAAEMKDSIERVAVAATAGPQLDAVPGADLPPPGDAPADAATPCADCHCHAAATLPDVPRQAPALPPRDMVAAVLPDTPSIPHRTELRPPIA